MDAEKLPTGLPRPGDTIAGKYVIVAVIGDGGMGVVYEANHLRLRRRVALKMLLPHMLAAGGDLVARFEREARAAGQLRDKHITRVLDVDTTSDGLPYLVMEYLEGHDLEAELSVRGPLPIAEAVGYVLQVCGAMAEAHAAGIVHRDLKPSNLFLTPDRDGSPLVKVLDFGISKMADEGDARLTGTQTSVGTPLYMSPEQVRSSRNVDSRSDIWSLGVILYELLAGRTPFEGSTTAAAAAIVADPTPPLRGFRPEVPPDLEAAIHLALCKDPNGRYGLVAQFAQAIAPFAGTIRPSMMPMSAASPSSSLTPRPTPPPSTPAFPRAGEGAETLASNSAPPRAPGTSLEPSTTGAGERRPTRWGLVAAASVAVVCAIAVLLAVAGRATSTHRAASAAPPPAFATASPASTTPVTEPPAPTPSAAPVVTAPQGPPSRATVARPAVALPPAAPRPSASARPAAAPAAAPSPPAHPTHGLADPLYL